MHADLWFCNWLVELTAEKCMNAREIRLDGLEESDPFGW